MAQAPSTMTEALDLLAAEGFSSDFNPHAVDDCERLHDLAHSTIERQFRFEGASDPGDESIVLGLSCPACGAKGVLVSAYGSDADPALFEVLAQLPKDPGAADTSTA